jgi:hypothetical protein
MTTAGELSGVTINARTFSRDADDFYIEPQWVVDALLSSEYFNGMVYDPAAGSGTVLAACRERDIPARGSDVSGRVVNGVTPGVDFLSDYWPVWAHNIICNPPYRDAQAFAEKAINLARGKVAILTQAKFLFSQKRHQLFSLHPPARIYFLSSRPSMPPGEAYLKGEVPARGGKVDYCWLVWAPNHHLTECHWLLKPQERVS